MWRQTLVLILISIMIHSVISFTIYYKDLEDLDTSPSELVAEYKKGGGKAFVQSEHSANGERGDKGYSSKHQEASGQKGHHDKEDHKKQYAEAGGQKKGHNHNDGYYDERHKAAKGQQGYRYTDSGSYAKGHDTKGRHNVHKLNEYNKKTEFFDEDHDKAFKEKHGSFEVSKDAAAGSAEKGGHGKKLYFEGEFGKSGNFEKGLFYVDNAGHKGDKGRDSFFDNGSKFSKNKEKGSFKDFEYADKH